MFVLKNAWAALGRVKWRTALTALLALLVSFSAAVDLAVLRADDKANNETYQSQKASAVIRPSAKVTAKRDGADSNYTANYMTWDMYTKYAEAVQKNNLTFEYTLATSVPVRASKSLQAIAAKRATSEDKPGGNLTLQAFYTNDAAKINDYGTFKVVKGKQLNYKTANDGVLVSQAVAKKNNLKVGDKATVGNPTKASETYKFTVSGIYEYTGETPAGYGSDAKYAKDNRENVVYTSYINFAQSGLDVAGTKGWAIPNLNIIFTLTDPATYNKFVRLVTKAKLDTSKFTISSPSLDAYKKRIAALEGGVAALATASGAAAITYTIEALAQAGDHIVAQKTIYGGSYNLLEHTLTQFGVTTTFVNAHDLAEVENAIQPNTKAIYLETLGNPNSDIPDIDAIAAIAHKHGLPLVIDNTFGTPYLIRPIEHGADIVVHSATKFIGGHGTTLGGIIVDSGKFDWKASGKFGNIADPNPSYHGVSFADAAGPAAFVTYIRAILLRDTGATISPFNAFLLLQGTETLSLRIERHVENTKKVVEFLANHPQVEKVNHPSLPDHPDHALYEKYFPNGGASIFTFNIKGGREEAFKFIDNLKIFSLLANVADVKSLVIHPASTTHSQLNDEELAEQQIYQNTIRLSIGTEHIDDIIADLEAGFAAVRGE